MRRIYLVHWKPGEALEKAGALRLAGLKVDFGPLDATGLRRLREYPPDAVVIDLGRLPSQGRDVAIALRRHRATRHVPLVFAGGEAMKVARIRELLPDATYSDWDEIEERLTQAVAHPPTEPVVPPSAMAAYSGRPLPKKLGIKAGSRVALFGTPDDFEEILEPLPDNVSLVRRVTETADLTLWFVRSRAELEGQIEYMLPQAKGGKLWIAWPKKASAIHSDLTQTVVRKVAMAAGLVDFKVCAIDATWSGLRFSLKKR